MNNDDFQKSVSMFGVSTPIMTGIIVLTALAFLIALKMGFRGVTVKMGS